VRALIGWNREAEAIDYAIEAMPLLATAALKTGKMETRDYLESMLEVLFRRQVQALLSQGKKREALAFYQDKVDLLPKSLRFSDHQFLLNLSEAASDLSFGKLARELAEQDHEVAANEPARDPSSDNGAVGSMEPTRKLRFAEERFAKAKALWVDGSTEMDFFKKGSAGAARVRKLLDEVGEQSKFSFEREIILSLMDAKEAETRESKQSGREQVLLRSALVHATSAQLLSTARPSGAPESLGSVADAMLASWVARLESRIGDTRIALEMCKNLESFIRKTEKPGDAAAKLAGKNAGHNVSVLKDPDLHVLGLPPVIGLNELLLLKAELLEKQSEWAAAAEAYAQVVEDGFSSNRVLFAQARALLKTGSAEAREKAMAILQKLADPKSDDLWKRLASETLSNSEIIQSSLKNQAKEGKK
jgi:hypothetical protein